MNSKSGSRFPFTNAGIAGAFLVFAGAAVAAQQLPKEGNFAYRACFSGTSKAVVLSKSHVAFSFDLTGETVADTPGTFLDHASFQCEGVASNFGKERTSESYCLYLDPDGDKAMMRIAMRNGEWHRQDIAGTGKYDGMTVHADVQPMGRFPTIKPGMFQGCNHSAGSYRLK